MSESSEVEAADESESTGETQSDSLDGLVGLFDNPPPSTAASATETIDSREEVHYCEEWDLFSDNTSDQPGVSDNEDSTDDRNTEGVDQPKLGCGNGDLKIDTALILGRSQEDDTNREDFGELDDDAKLVAQASSCETISSTISDRGNFAPSSDVQDDIRSDRPSSQCGGAGVNRRIQVIVRIRPSFDYEGKMVVSAGEKEGTSLCVQATTSQGSSSTVTECTFDRVFMGDATQEDIFAAVEPSVQACLEGYNATVFAYGQTGTGKTHTLFGRDLGSPRDSETMQDESGSFRLVKPSWGIVPRTLSYLLHQASILKQKNCQVELHLSFLQIYNDRLFDLLTDRMRQKPLLIREQPTQDGSTSVLVQGLSSESITSFVNAMQIINLGHTNRCVRETESNLSSSRSHAIVQLHVTTQYPNGEGQILRRARLNLVDLAGSEKWNTGVDMEDAHSQELKNINTSLSALGNCIAALTETGRKHIPYRDSTLTRVLQDSFGGNTQSCLIATINATQQCCDETLRTLQFADRARSVMQTIRVNEVADGSPELLMAKIQIVKLQERLDSEQRRRHETRLKEHQAMQRDFQEKLKSRDKEITKLTRDNAVFQKWREEDVKKIRSLESRLKNLEQQVDSSNGIANQLFTNATTNTIVQGPKRQSAAPASNSATKRTPVQKTRSRANLTKEGSENGTAARPYKQVLERYALVSSNGQQVRAGEMSKVVFDQNHQDGPSYDASNQHEDPTEAGPVVCFPVDQKSRWLASLDDKRVSDSQDIRQPGVARYQACISPVLCRLSENAASAAPKNSWGYSNSSLATTSSNTEWASSVLSKSTSARPIQKQESKEPWSSNSGSGSSASVPRREPAPLLKNASTGSLTYNSPIRTSAMGTVELCQKHKLAGCMLCSVNDIFRQPPAHQPAKEPAASFAQSKPSEVSRKVQDGPCERHLLLRCFICTKGSMTTTGTVQVSATASTSAVSSSSYTSTIAVNSSSAKALSYQCSPLQSESQVKCALHSLANCILCAGVKAMTRKVVAVPSPQASPVKVANSFDARSGNYADDRAAERYRRYTLDERILSYPTQPKQLANQW